MTPETINAITEHLMKMELSQIDACEKALIALANERAQQRKEAERRKKAEQKANAAATRTKPRTPGALPPTYTDINQLAELQDLDLSGLMKEIARK
ncbi:MAG: hypothetical protein ACPGMR_10885 [Pontibacterium sp.]